MTRADELAARLLRTGVPREEWSLFILAAMRLDAVHHAALLLELEAGAMEGGERDLPSRFEVIAWNAVQHRLRRLAQDWRRLNDDPAVERLREQMDAPPAPEGR
jgi:hypothetical protein